MIIFFSSHKKGRVSVLLSPSLLFYEKKHWEKSTMVGPGCEISNHFLRALKDIFDLAGKSKQG